MTEMEKLINLMDDAGIPYDVRTLWGGPQILYPNTDNCICDAVCHSFSYGHQEGLLEIMGLVDEEEVGDSVEGWLTGKQVFDRIKKNWEEMKNA